MSAVFPYRLKKMQHCLQPHFTYEHTHTHTHGCTYICTTSPNSTVNAFDSGEGRSGTDNFGEVIILLWIDLLMFYVFVY